MLKELLIGWICITNTTNTTCTAVEGGNWPIGSEVTCDTTGNHCNVTYYPSDLDNDDWSDNSN
jgi:hypothetical protein